MNKPKFNSIGVQYQILRKGAERPEDWGSSHGFEVDSLADLAGLPNVGDFVSLNALKSSEGGDSYHGKVRSKLFRQFTIMDESGLTAELGIGVTVVVEETDDDWGKLIKE
ncbi:hypothetical protein ROLI_012240 [Roseobacter fucihabitans]|uniref:Uncharacterized protein n=1 Tax=Roseobacter fucihabitans TaxID=1537242 RepID=A0ABZ2BS51_9RHOB|nr:hypothetical protein [Roseobacter litoralis]MBC6964248.1 hypothetical protein [Roseobacter litoralis]